MPQFGRNFFDSYEFSKMRAELICIVENFASQKEIVKDLYECSEEFRTLCLDYFHCVRSLEKWESTLETYRQRIEEFTELKRILEQKTLQYIDKKTSQQRSNLT